MGNTAALIVEVDIQEHGDHFYASSSDVAGLHVCGTTRDEVCQSAVAALKFLFKHNRGMNVQIVPAADSEQSFPAPVHSCDRFVALAA